MTELLSPAGSHEAFMAGINNGANAVYLGLKGFSARQNADNFDFSTLKNDVKYAHAMNVKVYVTVNTLIKNDEITDYVNAVRDALDCGVDAFIVQDMFFGKLLSETFEGIELHLSTQAGVCNIYGAKLAKEYGFKRVVLARETTFDDIKAISEIIETEVFIQGALCTAFSGQCYFSSFVGGNSGNRGLCKQPCRKKYKYFVGGKQVADGYVLSLKDLCVDRKIRELIDAGVTSFKIEGRMRRAEYVSATTKYYANLLCRKNTDKKLLLRTYNRGDYTYGIAFNDFKNIVSDKIQNHKGEYVGKISSIKKDIITLNTRESFINGDCFKIIRGGYEVGNAKVIDNRVRFNGDAKTGDDVNITTDVTLNEALISAKRTLDVEIKGVYLQGKKPELTAKCKDTEIKLTFEDVPEKAKNQSLTENEFYLNLKKVDDFPFDIKKITLETDGVFVPKSVLNRHRRELYDKLFDELSIQNYHKVLYKDFVFNYDTHNDKIDEKRTAILSTDFSFTAFDFLTDLIFCPNDYNNDAEFEKFFGDAKRFYGARTYLYIPAYLNETDVKIVKKRLADFDGVYGDGLFAIDFAKEAGKELFAGLSFNVFNSFDLKNLDCKIALSKELSETEIRNGGMIKKNSYVFDCGNVLLMNLIYCPFSKKCDNCNATEKNIRLVDEDGRVYRLRKYKLSSCRFEIYNESDLIFTGKKDFNELFNFCSYNSAETERVLKGISDGADLKELFDKYTYGNLKRGVK